MIVHRRGKVDYVLDIEKRVTEYSRNFANDQIMFLCAKFPVLDYVNLL